MSRQRESGKIPPGATLAFALLATLCSLAGVSAAQSQLATLKVISVRQVSRSEVANHVAEDMRPACIVRFRLEVSSNWGVYVLALGPMGAPPSGYALKRTAGSTQWLDGSSGVYQSKSPGVERLIKEGTSWIWLPASAAYEWEIEVAPTRDSHEESRSVFIRKEMKQAPTEIISSWYAVTDKNASE